MKGRVMEDIQQKLDKYAAPYVHGEKRSPEYEREIKEKQALKRRLGIAKTLKYEAKYLVITKTHMEQVNYLIVLFNDRFKQLHKRTSEETIILAFIFYTVRLDDSRVNLNNYRISKKYNLTDQVFSLIISRMFHFLLQEKPIPPRLTTEYNHELLYNSHGKI